jgi:hypothetical protein
MDIRLLAPTATCVAILVTVYLWRLTHKKQLSYSLGRHDPLLNLKGLARNDLDISFGGHSAIDAFLVTVRIFNSGHIPINPADYQTPVSLLFNPGTQLLTVSIIETGPVDLEDRIKERDGKKQSLLQKVEDERILLAPVLLNAGDSITIQILARNVTDKVKVTGHIYGVKKILIWKESRLLQKLFIQLGALIMAFAMLGVQPADLVQFRFDYILPWILTFLVGFVFLQAGIFWPRNIENRESLIVQ